MLTTVLMVQSVGEPGGTTMRLIRGYVILLVGLGIFGWLLIRALKRSEDPARLLFKWILTAPVLCFLIWVVAPMVAQGGYGGAFGGIPLAAVSGLFLAIIWRHNIASLIAKPFSDLYDGGDQEAEPRPVYSAAQANRKRGKYPEALFEVRKQLDKFPNDFEGQLLVSEILAEHMNDLPAAEMGVQRLCNQPGHPPRSIAYAWNSMADWYLKCAHDRDNAKRSLEKIIETFPDSELSALAAQRIAHLGSTEFLLAGQDRKRFEVAPGIQDIGLLPKEQQPKAPENDPVKQTAELVQHLEEHPLDTEAREKLALLYADHYGRLDLATEQMEQLISHPGQPHKRVVRWLNMLADLQVQHSSNYETVRQTVQRLIDLFPDSAAAQAARNRLDHLKLELKRKDKSQTIKLGSYEQDIGLKSRLPHEL